MYICIQFTINFLFVGLYTLYNSGSFRTFERVFSYSIQRCEFPFLCLVTRNKLAPLFRVRSRRYYIENNTLCHGTSRYRTTFVFA